MKFRTICTAAHDRQRLGQWLGLSDAPALEFTAARDDWRVSGYVGAWDRDDFAKLSLGQQVKFEDRDGLEFTVERIL